MRPVCVACGAEYVPVMNGIAVDEQWDGISQRVWLADLLRCPNCYHEIAAGFGLRPVLEGFTARCREARTVSECGVVVKVAA